MLSDSPFSDNTASTDERQRKKDHVSKTTSSKCQTAASPAEKSLDDFNPLTPSCLSGRGNMGTLLTVATKQESNGN